MDEDRCGVCDSRRHVGRCAGWPGAVYADYSHGWFSPLAAVALEARGITVEWDTIWSYSKFGLRPPAERIVFTDCETTGLDRDLHQITEIAWLDTPDPGVRTADGLWIVPHDLENAVPAALEISSYYERKLDDSTKWMPEQVPIKEILHATFEEAYVGGSNVGFDMGFITKRWGEMPWRHTPYEIGSALSGYLNTRRPFRLAEAAERQGIPHDHAHNAYADAFVARQIYYSMRASDPR